MTTKTTCEYRVEVKQPKQQYSSDRSLTTSTTTIAKAYCGTRCIGRFSGIHAEEQAEALIALAQAGATEASLSLCAADIGRAALHEKSLKDHPFLIDLDNESDAPIVKNAIRCGVCGAAADKFYWGFQCQANHSHIGDLNVGIFSDMSYPE